MDANDSRAIEDLFEKLKEAERNAPPRDGEAEELIRLRIRQSPAAPYYMAQTIIVQQQALEEAQRRIAELGGDAPREREGFLSGLFGGRLRQPAAARREERFDERRAAGGPWGPGYGGGFLAGAAQTAMGVAGGILLGNLIAGAFAGGSAHAGEQDRSDDRSADRDSDERSDNDNDGGQGDQGDSGGTDFADAGDFGGGDFGGGDV